jgi:2-methylcitrate dehydratase PrpD
MDRIKVEPDESLLADYPHTWPARVRVTANGEQHAWLVTHVPGDPARAFDRSATRDKFMRFTSPVLGSHKAGHMLARSTDAFAAGDFAALVAEIEQACTSAAIGSKPVP